MSAGSLRRAIERISPMLLHRSIRTGSSIFANYRATGRSLAHGLCPLKRREKRRCCFSTDRESASNFDPFRGGLKSLKNCLFFGKLVGSRLDADKFLQKSTI